MFSVPRNIFALFSNVMFTTVSQKPSNVSLLAGVGKTSLTHLIANNEALTSPGWTVGCAVEVKLHEYKEGTASQRTYFIELWDVGGSISHKNTRSVFYNPVHGIVLVHDLTNRRSQENLQSWICEIVNRDRDGKDVNRSSAGFGSVSSTSAMLMSDSIEFDPEQFMGMTQVTLPACVDRQSYYNTLDSVPDSHSGIRNQS